MIESQLDIQPIQSPIQTAPWRWATRTFRAMNTGVQTHLYTDQRNADEILHDVKQLFHSFERRLSRFDSNSELSRLNSHPEPRFPASPLLIDALAVALWAADQTGGLYDPTILAALERAGYDRSFEQIEQPRPLRRPAPASAAGPATARRPQAAFRTIHINRPRRQITRPVGLRLDLGGMGKGYTVDRAADRLQGLGPFLVNAGGDIFAYQSPPGQPGWKIELTHPLVPEQHYAQLCLHHRALATSTIARRRWHHNGRMMHHLIDPRTGIPAQTDALSVSVIADRTVVAEVLAKVVLILGVEVGLAYLQQVPDVEGLIFSARGQVIYTAGLASLIEQLEPEGYASSSSKITVEDKYDGNAI